MRSLAAGIGLIAALGACNVGAQREDVVALLDADVYAAEVQVIVAFSCGTLDCHGVPGRPLRIYAVNGLRLRDGLRNQPIADEELQANVVAFTFVSGDSTNVDTHLALVKPLSKSAGGYAHVGGAIWDSADDPGYRCVRAWLAGSSDPDACAAAVPAMR